MNKQELIERIEGLDKLHGEKFYIALDDVLDLMKQLDEPQKVTIPQFVADWIEESKKHCKNVVEFFKYKYPNVEMIKWIGSEKQFDLIARAWLDGYEVEKEKQYLVKIGATKHYFAKDGKGKIFFSLAYKGSFTKKELEDAGFGWVFDCPGIEIEEVE